MSRGNLHVSEVKQETSVSASVLVAPVSIAVLTCLPCPVSIGMPVGRVSFFMVVVLMIPAMSGFMTCVSVSITAVVCPLAATIPIPSVCMTASVLVSSVINGFLSLRAIILPALGPMLFFATSPAFWHLFFFQGRPPATLVPTLFRLLSSVLLAVSHVFWAFIPAVPFGGAFPLLTGLMRAAVSVLPAGCILIQQEVILLCGFATLSRPGSLQPGSSHGHSSSTGRLHETVIYYAEHH